MKYKVYVVIQGVEIVIDIYSDTDSDDAYEIEEELRMKAKLLFPHAECCYL